jgi:hypothetical protein
VAHASVPHATASSEGVADEAGPPHPAPVVDAPRTGGTPDPWTLRALGALLVLGRLPFLWTGHLQDDAFIAFRTAFNLADHGVLGFNVGEHYAATTSLIYAYFCAAVRWLSGERAVTLILGCNAVLAAFAVVRLIRVLSLTGRSAWVFALCVGCSSGALLPAFNGMETAWCLAYLALLAEHCAAPPVRPWVFGALLALGPLLRPDTALLSAGAWLIAGAAGDAERRRRVCGAVGLGLGLGLLVLCNRLHSGTWLPPSIVAKRAAYHPDLSPLALLSRIWDVYFGGALSPLPPTKYLPRALLVASSSGLWAALGVAVSRSRRLPEAERRPFLLLAGAAALFPLALAAPGALFPWYFHPSSFALAASVAFGVDRGLLGVARRPWAALALAVSALSLPLQLALSLNVGRQESGYRASVGRYLAEAAHAGDTLVLEPAGIIPYHAGLITFDEVGLTSPRVLSYIASGRETWLAEFLRDVCPTFTVQRDVFPPPAARPPSADEAWFSRSYRVRRRFAYVPDEWARSELERWLLRHGQHSDYVVYERRDATDCAASPDSHRGPAPPGG